MKQATILALAILIAATALAATTEIELARVNGDPVSSREILEIFTDRHSGHAKFLGGEVEARTFLKLVIEDRLLVQEAYDIGIDQEPEVVKLVGDHEASSTTKYLVSTEIDQKAAPSPDEVKKAWETNLNFYVKVRQIAVGTKQEAEEVRAALLSGADFETLAVNCSQADSRFHRGHAMVGWGQFDPEWERVVFAMQPGEVSPPIPTPNGYDVVILDEHADMPRPDFEKVSGQIEVVLRQRRTAERKKALSDELWSKYHVVPAQIDLTPAGLLRALAVAPETALATWDGGGKLTVKDAFAADELRALLPMPPASARSEVESRIRATVNGPLVEREAKERKIAEIPAVAQDIQRYREYVVESVLFRDHIFKNLAVSPDDLQSYYESHKSEFIAPEERHVAQILLGSEEEAIEVRRDLEAGADFEEIAKKSSRDFTSGRSGGDLGWITGEKVPPAFSEVLKLGKGEMSKPTHTGNGWHIIKVTEIKPSRQLTLDEAKDSVQKKALDGKQRAARDEWVSKLRSAAKIEIHDAAIKQFVKENQYKGEAPPQHIVK